MIQTCYLLAFFALLLRSTQAANITMTVKFPETSLNAKWFDKSSQVFGLSWYTCTQTPGYNASNVGTPTCPLSQSTFTPSTAIYTSDKNGLDTWVKVINVPNSFETGPVTIYLFSPTTFSFNATLNPTLSFSASVLDCLELADQEMSGEICGLQGQPYTIMITDPGQQISFTVYPAFGIANVGKTEMLLTNFYSPELNNTRNIPVYIPPSLVQNNISRTIDVIIVLDASISVVESYSTASGFEALQKVGVVPESIMLGISYIDFIAQGNFAQRGYELTYETDLLQPNSCIGASPSGGTDLLLTFIEKTMLPAAMAKLGMTLGEVSIHGGSLGGLTSCYAASKNPSLFVRAICSAPSNCFNWLNGGLSSVIPRNYVNTGNKPKTVIQFLSHGESVSGDGNENDSDEKQMKWLLRDDAAWQSIGMIPVTSELSYTSPPDSFGYHNLKPLPNNVVMTLVSPGGQHAPMTWMQQFAAALPILYRADRRDKLRIPKSETLEYFSLPAPSADSSCNSGTSGSDGIELSAGELAACVLLPSIFTIMVMLGYNNFVLKPMLSGANLLSKSTRSDI